MAGQLGDKIIVPGLARGEGNNHLDVEEVVVRNIFGLYEKTAPGVFDTSKGCPLLMSNVKRNKPLLDNGILVILDGSGSHVIGKGTSEYQAKVVDAAMQENQNLKDGYQNFIEFFVSQGFSEEDAKKIAEGKMKANEVKMKMGDGPKVATGEGVTETKKSTKKSTKSESE